MVTSRSRGMEISGLVLGLVGLVLDFIPCLGFFGITCGILAVIFSGVGLHQANKAQAAKSMAVAGLVLGIIAVVLYPIVFIAALSSLH